MTYDWFEFKGERSTTYGLYVSEPASISRGAERFSFADVPGRSGSLTFREGDSVFDDITYKVSCVVKDMSHMNDIFAWLTGVGSLVLANKPDTQYTAAVTSALTFKRVLRGRTTQTIEITFRCKPFGLRLPVAQNITITATGYDLVNPGNAPALPKLTITGHGDMGLSIGMQTMWFYDMESTEPIVLDCELGDALNSDCTMLMNNQVEGDFFEIPPGHNTVQFTEYTAGSGFSSIVVEPRWRMM